MNMIIKIFTSLNMISKKPDISTYESRQDMYKKNRPWLAFFNIFMMSLICIIPLVISIRHNQSNLTLVTPFVLFTVLFTFGTVFIPFLNKYASIDDEGFLDKIFLFKILKNIKRNHSFNAGYYLYIAITLLFPIYFVIKVLYPVYGTYPLMDPSPLLFELEKVTSFFEGLAVCVMFIYLFGNTSEQDYHKDLAKAKKLEKMNIVIANKKFTYQHLKLVKILFAFAAYCVAFGFAYKIQNELIEVNLPVKYANESEVKVIPYSHINLILGYDSPDVELYNASLMGEPISQILLASVFSEVEYKETPELSKAIAFSLIKGLKAFQSSKARMELMIDKYPILGKTSQQIYKAQDIELEIKLLDLIYKNDLTNLKTELEKHQADIFISHKDQAEKVKESIAPLSAIIITDMVNSGNFEYDPPYLNKIDKASDNPRHDAAKEMVKLMTFFESAHHIQ